MKKIQTAFTATALFVLTASQVTAQTNVTRKMRDINNTVTETRSRVDSATAVLAGARRTIDGLLGKTKSKTRQVIITIGGAEAEDAQVDKLVEALKKVDGFKKYALRFAGGITTIECEVKEGQKSEFWRSVAKEAKAPFKTISYSPDAVEMNLRQATNETEGRTQ